jgi:hypothetical protein
MSCSFARNNTQASASQSAARATTARLSRSQSFAYQSNVEQAVINSKAPIAFNNETEEVQAGRFRGKLLNRDELQQFRGPIPLEQYKINDDQNPEVIRKRLDKLRYTQEVAVRYLNPPAPQKPGDLIIREKQSQIPPAPPVVLRQEGQGAATPEVNIFIDLPPPPQKPKFIKNVFIKCKNFIE